MLLVASACLLFLSTLSLPCQMPSTAIPDQFLLPLQPLAYGGELHYVLAFLSPVVSSQLQCKSLKHLLEYQDMSQCCGVRLQNGSSWWQLCSPRTNRCCSVLCRVTL